MCPTTGAPWAQPCRVLSAECPEHLRGATFRHLLIYLAVSGLTSLVVCKAEVQELKMVLKPK